MKTHAANSATLTRSFLPLPPLVATVGQPHDRICLP